MACENDKYEKYGLHHDYKDGIEIRKCFACKKDEMIEFENMEDFEEWASKLDKPCVIQEDIEIKDCIFLSGECDEQHKKKD